MREIIGFVFGREILGCGFGGGGYIFQFRLSPQIFNLSLIKLPIPIQHINIFFLSYDSTILLRNVLKHITPYNPILIFGCKLFNSKILDVKH